MNVLLAIIVVHPSTEVVSILVGIVLPLVTGVVTKLRADSAVKAVANALLVVVTAALTTLVTEPEAGIPLYDFLYSLFFAGVASGASYAHLWKPTGIAEQVQRATARFGLGDPFDTFKP